MIDRLAWLHVSDLHFVAHGDEFSQHVATQSLLDDVPARVAGLRPPGFVLVTGDIAFSGRVEEYDRASEFLSRLASAAQVPQDRFFFVPGNHDVDRARNRLAYIGACSDTTSQPAVDRLLGSTDDLAPLIDRQSAFRAFVDAFTGDQDRTQTDDGLAYVVPVDIEGLKLSLLGLNSAWLSGKNAEEMKLVIGERQVINAVELAKSFNPQLLIAMAHHPIGWLQEWDQMACHERLLPQVQFFHRGHLHMAEVSLSSSPERPCLAIAAGSSHATRFYANSYNLIDLDLGAGTCTVHPFRFEPDKARYVKADLVTASVLLSGALPGTRDDLRSALATTVPVVEPYAGYLADLITGQKGEIPVEVGTTVEFRTPAFAEAVAPADLRAAIEFLRLRNVLRLYDTDVSLSERLEGHVAVIEAFGRYLSSLAARDQRCADRLVGAQSGRHETEDHGATSLLPYTADFLADLRRRGDWTLLAIQAARFVYSSDAIVARLAKVAVVEALMHSDEADKRNEARRLAAALAQDPEASADDYLLAAACSEVVNDDTAAVEFANQALATWSDQLEVRRYARGLALRTGDSALRTAVDNAAGGRGAE